MQHAVVTGGTGIIGLALIQYLCDRYVDVTVLVRPDSQRSHLIPKNNLIKIIDNENLLPRDADTFFHLRWAASTPDILQNTTIQGNEIIRTLEMIDLARKIGCSNFIGIGSQAESRTTTAYGVAKLATCNLARLRCEQLNMRFCWAKILSVYGPHDKDRTCISYCIDTLLKGNSPKITRGYQPWDYIYSEDCAHALYDIAMYGHNGKSYSIGSGQSRPLREYLKILRDYIDPFIELDYSPLDGDISLISDITELTTDTGFKPIYSFDHGIKITIDHRRSLYVT